MNVTRTNVPDDERASGAITPLLRAATHLGYILGGISSITQEAWDAASGQINNDARHEMEQAIMHMRFSPLIVDENPYVSAQAVVALRAAESQITSAAAQDAESLRDLMETVTNLIHNFAFAGEFIDRDSFGLTDATAGRQL